MDYSMRNMTWEIGKTYEFTFANKEKLTLKLLGFNKYMNREWLNPVNNQTINDVPPYESVKLIG